MGCCASAPLDTTVVYEGTTKHVSNCTVTATLRVRICELFPEVADNLFEMLDKDGTNWTQRTYQAALQQNREATVTIHRLVPYAFQDPHWENLSSSVFRLFVQSKVCLSTGFLISPTLGLTSWEGVKGLDLQGLKAHFEKPEKKVVEVEIVPVLAIASMSRVPLAIVRLKEPQNRPFTKLNRSVSAAEGEPVTTIFVSYHLVLSAETHPAS